MLMIRFQRIGRKNDPAFRMVVLPKASGPKAGSYVELVGTYNPKTKAMTVQPERIKEWMSKGAQVSPSLMNLLISKGILEGTKFASVSKKNMEKNKPAEVEASPEVVAAPVADEAVIEEAPAEEVAPEAPAVEETPVEVEAAPEETTVEEAMADAEVVEEEATPAA